MRCVFIIPYYGTFPNYFDLFLRSCADNPNLDWLIFSEGNSSHQYPDNVQYVEMPWEDLKRRIGSCLNTEVVLNRPYKLCDYRPTYGLVFADYISKYDYWGYCDIDLVFGDLSRFLTEDVLNAYDKIGHLGHMALIRNDETMNNLFRTEVEGAIPFLNVIKNDAPCMFDEWDGLSFNRLCELGGHKLHRFNQFFDVYPNESCFKPVTRNFHKIDDSESDYAVGKHRLLAVREGNHLYMISGKEKQEVAYIHLQKRQMALSKEPLSGKIIFYPNRIVNYTKSAYRSAQIKNWLLSVVNFKKLRHVCLCFTYKVAHSTSVIRHKIFLNKEAPLLKTRKEKR